MSAKPRLAFIGNQPPAIRFFREMLEYVFDGDVEIVCYSTHATFVDSSIPFVLVSHDGYFDYAKKLFPNSAIVIADKVLTGQNLDKVMMLPAGTKVLVVVKPQKAILETIESLTALGIKHVEYIPYNPESHTPPKGIDTAISPGLMHLCPAAIKNRIDIGIRTMSASSFHRLLLTIGLESRYLDRFNSQYNRPAWTQTAGTTRELPSKAKETAILQEEHEFIINKVQDGILSVTSDKKIISLNNAMADILAQPKKTLLDQYLPEILAKVSTTKDLLYDIDESFSTKITINNIKYFYTSLRMQKDSLKHYIFTFKKEAQLNILEEKAQAEVVKKGYIAKYNITDMSGTSSELMLLKDRALLFAKNDINILIFGESGTGKELLAQAIHNNSPRAHGPFLPINFAALPESLIESELFGYEEGAFTGAKKGGKPGYFEMAKGGTIFIDEIGDMPLSLQPRLLRILQEREIIRLGGSKVIPIDVRVIAATNVDLKEQVANNKFRADLYYRLNVLSLNTVPLRNMRDSIEVIFKEYIHKRYSFYIEGMDGQVRHTLLNYNWPGNVRELMNVADFAYFTAEGNNYLTMKNIPPNLTADGQSSTINIPICNSSTITIKSVNYQERSELVKQHILQVILAKQQFNVSRRMIIAALREYNINITEHYLKMFMSQLKDEGLVRIGTTKQGTTITEQGLQFLKDIQSL